MNLSGNEQRIVTWNHTVSEEIRKKLHATAFPPGSIIFPKIGAAIATNKKRILTIKSCVDNNVMAVVFRKEVKIPYGYGLFLFKNISDFASSSEPPSMRKSEVEQWLIPIPPVELQASFAERVNRIEPLARNLDIAAANAATIAAALSAEVFG